MSRRVTADWQWDGAGAPGGLRSRARRGGARHARTWPRALATRRHNNQFGTQRKRSSDDGAAEHIGSARSRRPPADHLTLRRSPSTGSRLRCPAGRSRRQPSTHVTRTALLDRCSEQEYEAVGTDGCPAAEVRDHCGSGDGPGGGVRESDVADLPVSHEVVQCGDGFFDRCVCAGRNCAASTGRCSPCRDARGFPRAAGPMISQPRALSHLIEQAARATS
jgi:hypothetical protein